MRPEDSYVDLATCIALRGGGSRERAVLAVHAVMCEDAGEQAAEAGEWQIAHNWFAESERTFVMLVAGARHALTELYAIDPSLNH